MNKVIVASALLSLSTLSVAAPVTSKSPEKQQISYSYGYFMGKSNTEILKQIDLDSFTQGLREAVQNKKPSLDEEQMAKVIGNYKKKMEAAELIQFQKVAQQNQLAGEKFLAENAQKEGIKTTASGLQYQVLKEGQGPSPKATSTVKVNYEGRLLDGTVFDSSFARNQPVEFQLSQVISGWTEGLQLMKAGAKYRLFIPAALGYGEIGSGDAIGPNSTLIFDVELLEIVR